MLLPECKKIQSAEPESNFSGKHWPGFFHDALAGVAAYTKTEEVPMLSLKSRRERGLVFKQEPRAPMGSTSNGGQLQNN